ncbi:MAG: AMP-binding protein [bacterium]
MEREWRLFYKPEGDAADLIALPASIVEGRIASRYLLSSKITAPTIIVQGVSRRGIVAGANVIIDKEEAKKADIDIALRGRSGRGEARIIGTISYQELISRGSSEFECGDVEEDALALLLYTSGTTGKPKGVMLTHCNLMAEYTIAEKIFSITPEDRFAAVVPFFHVYGLADVLMVAIFRGSSIVLIPQYSPKELMNRLSEDKITILITIPTQFLHLVMLARHKPAPLLSLRISISGAASLPLDVIKEFERIFSTKIAEGYGLTESTAAVSANPSERIKPGSIGPPAPGIEMKVVNENDEEVPIGKEGEIVIRGEVVMKGYYNRPQETEEILRNGWLHTGDIGYKDEEGYFYITGRKKEIIIKAGFNISPGEVEEVISSYPKVKETCVIGVGESKKREEIKAFVVLKEGERSNQREIIGWCRQRLASCKVPDYVEFRDILPRSVTGKVLRKELRDDYQDPRFIEERNESGKID